MSNEERLLIIGRLTEIVKCASDYNKLSKNGLYNCSTEGEITRVGVSWDLFDDLVLATSPKVAERKVCEETFERSIMFGKIKIASVFDKSVFDITETMQLIEDLIFEREELK